MDLTVSIINTDNRDLLRECLRSLFEGTKRLSLEVYVVENASTDGSAEMVRREFPQVQQIIDPRRLRFCANHNQVLRQGRGRYLVILNEDTEIRTGTFDDLVAFMDAHPDVGAAGVTVLNSDGTHQGSFAAFPSLRSPIAMVPPLNPELLPCTCRKMSCLSTRAALEASIEAQTRVSSRQNGDTNCDRTRTILHRLKCPS